MLKHWILKDRKEVEVGLEEWARWLNSFEKIVGRTYVGKFLVSTVFLGLDHGVGLVPVLYETMVRKGDEDWLGYGRYTSFDAAVAGHDKIVEEVRQGL